MDEEGREAFTRYLERDDPCFGENFAKSAEECQNCNLTLLWEGRVVLLREVCEMECHPEAEQPRDLKRLASRQVLEMLEDGATMVEIFEEILNGTHPDMAGAEARAILKGRFSVIREEWEGDVPEVPHTRDLVAELEGDGG